MRNMVGRRGETRLATDFWDYYKDMGVCSKICLSKLVSETLASSDSSSIPT